MPMEQPGDAVASLEHYYTCNQAKSRGVRVTEAALTLVSASEAALTLATSQLGTGVGCTALGPTKSDSSAAEIYTHIFQRVRCWL